jgi:hypothetical protein
VPNDAEQDKARTEGAKLMFDAIKHLTTLSTGSILFLVALLEKVFKTPHWRALVAISFSLFILSILTSMRVMVFMAGHVARRGETVKPITPFYIVGAWSFLAAIICFAIFVVRNLWL